MAPIVRCNTEESKWESSTATESSTHVNSHEPREFSELRFAIAASRPKTRVRTQTSHARQSRCRLAFPSSRKRRWPTRTRASGTKSTTDESTPRTLAQNPQPDGVWLVRGPGWGPLSKPSPPGIPSAASDSRCWSRYPHCLHRVCLLPVPVAAQVPSCVRRSFRNVISNSAGTAPQVVQLVLSLPTEIPPD